MGNAAKVQTALKLSEEDQQTIVALKKEIEKAWKMVDASHEKVIRRQNSHELDSSKQIAAYTACRTNQLSVGHWQQACDSSCSAVGGAGYLSSYL